MTEPAATAASAPIGVFDSGVGGLTVVRELIRQLPRESLIYFGDTARVPYGPKSPETIRGYSREIAGYLISQGVKAVVVACNTATAQALPMLASELTVPVIGVVEPGARAAVAATRGGGIGVIGTAGTVASGAYEHAIHAVSPTSRVVAQACPLFVPLVEEGWLDTEATTLIARQYLAPIVAAGVDTLVLGCTHYPLLSPVIAPIVGESVRLIDSAYATAAATRAAIGDAGLSRPTGAVPAPQYRFIVSDAPDQFLRAGRRFLGSAIERVETRTFG
ncbi:MAG: glutamate racemase [Gemmatimonadales bacterium]